jgi:hypothetical protein
MCYRKPSKYHFGTDLNCRASAGGACIGSIALLFEVTLAYRNPVKAVGQEGSMASGSIQQMSVLPQGADVNMRLNQLRAATRPVTDSSFQHSRPLQIGGAYVRGMRSGFASALEIRGLKSTPQFPSCKLSASFSCHFQVTIAGRDLHRHLMPMFCITCVHTYLFVACHILTVFHDFRRLVRFDMCCTSAVSRHVSAACLAGFRWRVRTQAALQTVPSSTG